MASTEKFDQVFRPVILVFRLVGLWPRGKQTITYIVYGAMVFLIFSLFLTIIEFIQLFKFTESGKLTATMFMALTDLAVLLKYVNFYWRWQAMQEMHKSARNFRLETEAEVKLFNKRMQFNYWIVMSLFISVNTAHTGTELKTIFSPNLLLPFPAWYPESWFDDGIKYWLMYAHNSIGHVIGSNLVSAIDGYPTSLLFIVSVQMEILGLRLKAIGNDELLSRNRQNRERIIKCIQIHQQILELSIFVPFSQ